ncbi:MAG: hypothetical protein ABI851_14230 [Saprospiraceae bacterium]
MLNRKDVEKQINEMPSEFTLDELVERLILIEKINTGMNEFAEGKTITEEELDKRMEKWFA